MDLDELNKIIDESGLKRTFLAQRLGWSDTKLHNRTHGKSGWTIKDVDDVSKLLRLSRKQKRDIFLP